MIDTNEKLSRLYDIVLEINELLESKGKNIKLVMKIPTSSYRKVIRIRDQYQEYYSSRYINKVRAFLYGYRKAVNTLL